MMHILPGLETWRPIAGVDGPPPSDDHQAAHWDGNPHHNFEWNLRWATPADNTKDKYRHGTILTGSDNLSSRITPEKVAVAVVALEVSDVTIGCQTDDDLGSEDVLAGMRNAATGRLTTGDGEQDSLGYVLAGPRRCDHPPQCSRKRTHDS